jgi:hypothetical protein
MSDLRQLRFGAAHFNGGWLTLTDFELSAR